MAILFACLLLASCKDNDDDVNSDSTSEIPALKVLFPIDGLGDRSYCDNIYEGLCKVREKYSDQQLKIEYFVPSSMAEADSAIQYWYHHKTSRKQLFVTCNFALAKLFEGHSDWISSNDTKVLVLGTDRKDFQLNTRYISLYGICHMAGQVVKQLGVSKAAIILANREDSVILDASQGFLDGFSWKGGQISASEDIYHLTQKSGMGYDMADSLFKLSYRLDQSGYRFVFPVCGGSSQGAFSYTRLNLMDSINNPFYTCGFDVDQQIYSKRIAFSVIAQYNLVLEDFVKSWLNDESMPLHETEDLSTNYVDIVVADSFKEMESVSQKYLPQIKSDAIKAETNYLNRNQ